MEQSVLETENDQNFFRFFDRSAVAQNDVPLNRDDFYTKLASTEDSKMPTKVARLDVAVSNVTPTGDEVEVIKEYWEYLVVSGLQGGRARKMACHPNTRHLKLVPVKCSFDIILYMTECSSLFPFILRWAQWRLAWVMADAQAVVVCSRKESDLSPLTWRQNNPLKIVVNVTNRTCCVEWNNSQPACDVRLSVFFLFQCTRSSPCMSTHTSS